MTLTEWSSNPQLAASLRAFLETPVGQAAMDVLKRQSPAKVLSGRMPWQNTGHGESLANMILGYEQALISLENLSLPEDARPEAIRETYGVLSEKDATE